MKVVFMGTPDFGVPVLRAIADAGHEILAVVTQPDRPKGRGKGVSFSPVKEEALRLDVPVFQPEKVKQPEAVQYLASLTPDVIVVVAFGQILSQEILDIPRFGCVNVHASLLPLYRGAAPIQQAILDGAKKTGITTMLMDKGLDTGDILLQEELEIRPDETGGTLFDRLSVLGASLLVKTLDGLAKGEITPVPQAGESTYAGMFNKSMGRIDWTRDAAAIERQIRAMDPWPSAFTHLDGKMIKVWKAEVVKDDMTTNEAAPGTILGLEGGILVACGTGRLNILELQPEGRRRMDFAAYLRGYPLARGTLLS